MGNPLDFVLAFRWRKARRMLKGPGAWRQQFMSVQTIAILSGVGFVGLGFLAKVVVMRWLASQEAPGEAEE